jgi:hypothetical protein
MYVVRIALTTINQFLKCFIKSYFFLGENYLIITDMYLNLRYMVRSPWKAKTPLERVEKIVSIASGFPTKYPEKGVQADIAPKS